jgi:putative FmdB family regulatory protein
MPTYEYRCLKCGHLFEELQHMTEEPLKKCPKCKGKVKRLIGSGSGLIFKGSGFYITDYKKKSAEVTGNNGKKPPAKAKKPDASPDSSKGSSSDSASKKTEKS